ncbi:hypothetical protein M422DRAFT_196854, partial [Sphaerobolus stellatus SS14]
MTNPNSPSGNSTTLPSDATSPSILALRHTQTYTGPKLDKLKSNYNIWLKSTDLFLTLAGCIGYAKAIIPPPGPTEPRALANWYANDALTAALIASTIEVSEWEFIDRDLGASSCWNSLKTRHQSEGPIRQVQLLQEALTTKCSKDTPLPTTAEAICKAIDRAYEMGEITQDLLKCIALLSSLSDFPHLRSMITRDLSIATKSIPFTSAQLRAYLDGEQTLMNSDSKNIPDPLILAAQTKSPIVVCSNCKRNGHVVTYCISSGGGMEGKTIEE